MLKAAGSLRNSQRPAKGVQFAVVVQQEGGEEVVTTHVLGYVEPVMNSHPYEAAAPLPRRLGDVLLLTWDKGGLSQWITSRLNVQVTSCSFFLECRGSSPSCTDNGRIGEVSCQGHTIVPIFLENVSERKGRKIVGKSSLKQPTLNASDVAVDVI